METKSPIGRWEYITVDQVDRMKSDEIKMRFDELGEEGWELAGLVEYGAQHRARAVFKRPVEGSEA